MLNDSPDILGQGSDFNMLDFRNEMRPADSDILSTRPPEYTDTMEHQEIPDDIQSRLICHVPDFVWSGVSPAKLNVYLTEF